MRAFGRAERFVGMMEADPHPSQIAEIEELERAIAGVAWVAPEDRQASQTILLRLALLKHAARAAGRAAPEDGRSCS